MTLRHRLALVAGLVVGLSTAIGPVAVAQDASPSASPAAMASPAPVVSPCPPPGTVESPAPTASAAAAASASPAAAGTSASLQAETTCPDATGSTVVIPAGATVDEILALGIGGVELSVQSGGLQFVDPKSRWYRQLRRQLRAQRKTTDDVVQHIGTASPPHEVLVAAFEIRGADAAPFLDLAIVALTGLELRRLDREAGEVAGKAVTIVRSAQSPDRALYFVPSGDAVWFVIGPDAFVTEFIGALP
jgi:hypothetical protein